MANVKIGLLGGDGKMGRAVEQMFKAVKSKNTLEPFLFVASEASPIFSFSAEEIENVEDEILREIDVWIEFTSPEGLRKLLKKTSKHKSAIVSGSTGLSAKDFSLLKLQSKKRRIFWSSNMSLGLWAFRQAMQGLKHISHFDFAIEETHHTQKKDRPSGTAKTLHQDLQSIVNKKIETPTSFRLGGIFGVHTLFAASSNEVITMQHQALNRTVFAEGALIAADWIADKKPGLYSMDNLFTTKN